MFITGLLYLWHRTHFDIVESGVHVEQNVWPQLSTIGLRVFEYANLQDGQFIM